MTFTKKILCAQNVNFKDVLFYKDIEIFENQTTFVEGASGCGKSTLLKLFNGTLSPKSGSIFYNNQSLECQDTILLRCEVLLCAQSVYLFDGDIEFNFNEFRRYRELPPSSQDEIKGFLDCCQADFPLDSNCTTLSGGERQRVFIAICLSLMPKVIMLDEPTSALDSETARNLLSNIKSFCRENRITLIVVSHDQSLAAEFADKRIRIESGGSICKE